MDGASDEFVAGAGSLTFGYRVRKGELLMATGSRRDDVLGAIGVIILLIGTATGNAYAMLGMSVTALALLAVFCRRQIGSGAHLVAFVAAVTAAVIGIVVVAIR
jgi:hypothetical protein